MTHAGDNSARRRRELAAIHVAKKQLMDAGRLSEDGYRAIVDGILTDRALDRTKPHPSAADLDAGGRSAVLAVFRETLGWDDPAHRDRDNLAKGRYIGRGSVGQPGHLTQEQAGYIARLEDQLGWSNNPRRIAGFIKRVTGSISTVEMLSSRNASKLIIGLERLTGRNPHPRSAQA